VGFLPQVTHAPHLFSLPNANLFCVFTLGKRIFSFRRAYDTGDGQDRPIRNALQKVSADVCACVWACGRVRLCVGVWACALVCGRVRLCVDVFACVWACALACGRVRLRVGSLLPLRRIKQR
jgi:hypothetical protein